MERVRTRQMENADAEIRRMMEAYGSSMLRMCFLYLRDAALAEDAVQESFLKAYRHLDGFRGESGEKTWLMRIAINTCKDFHRSAWARLVDRRVALDGIQPAAGDAEPSDDTVIHEVMRLSDKDKEVILLRYYQNMKIWEISGALNIPKGTVTSRLNRAREKLHRRLKGWYFDEGEL